MKKILVLEDEASIRSFIVINLRRAGYDVIEAETGEEALERASFFWSQKKEGVPGRLPSPVQPLRPTPYCGASGSTNSVVKLAVRSLMFIRTLQKTSP